MLCDLEFRTEMCLVYFVYTFIFILNLSAIEPLIIVYFIFYKFVLEFCFVFS